MQTNIVKSIIIQFFFFLHTTHPPIPLMTWTKTNFHKKNYSTINEFAVFSQKN